ncbi:MAG TPA: SDR family oxidoreductase [Chloroflexota bacterium]|nr:SDR family oxidoreductase [Chloroflexota bacterium]
MADKETFEGSWALILGASSGFGGAAAAELARKGMDIFGVHLDRSSTLPNAEKVMEEIRGHGRQAVFFNINAASAEKRAEVLDKIEAILAEQQGAGKVRVLFHSLAFGSLGEFVAADPKRSLTQPQIEMTLDVMANSLVYWARDLVTRGLMVQDGRIYAMTSSGSYRVLPNYGAVSAAKACLESHIRQLAVELSLKGITANALMAGITDTAALRKIPGHERLIQEASARNPMGRMTTPADVAATLGTICGPETYWLSGNTLKVDGGENNIG